MTTLSLDTRLRNYAQELRTKPIPLAELIPLLQQAADDLGEITALRNENQGLKLALSTAQRPSIDAVHTDGVPCASGLSDFIRNASPEHKTEVYGKVMDKVSEQQQAIIDGVPQSIYLQVNQESPNVDDSTWCRDKINDTDVLYVRADVAPPAPGGKP
jgi:hypothetical protein